MRMERKPRVAFFDFACCEGCQLSVLQLEEKLLEMLDHVEIVTWREVMTDESDDYDIAFCEGSITRESDLERIRHIRNRARILVSLGACASIGCHNVLRNRWSVNEAMAMVYGDAKLDMDIIPARPVTAVVDVDYQVQGCPASLPEFLSVFKHILTGQVYRPPNQPVCVECKLRDNLCVLEKGMLCLGPVTRCGCEAICTSYGNACHGCRGLVDEANLRAAARVLSAEQLHSIMAEVAKRHRLSEEEVMDMFGVYNSAFERVVQKRQSR